MNSDAVAPARALALLSDLWLRDEVRRIAAAADRPLDEPVLPPARHAWTTAGVVIVDTAAALRCASADHPRRAGILLVTAGEPGLLDWQAATAVGAEQVLALPAAADALIAAFAACDQRGRGDGAVVAVAGACGRSGASTLAAAVPLTAAGHFRERTLLVDAAPFGGGLDLLLGLENTPGLRWPDLVIEDGRVAAAALHDALPATAGVSLLSCGRGAGATELAPTAVRSVVEAGRSAGDLVVCDLSSERGPHAAQILDAADAVILVVPARFRAVAAAESVAAHVVVRNPNVHLVVRGPAPVGLRGEEVAEVLHLPLLASVPPQPRLTERLEYTGLTVRRRGPLRLAAEAVLTALDAVGEPRSRVSAPVQRPLGAAARP
ncbi:septum site-determining protein Ssd [Nocardia crassostreae]|uniref:septum site-determining protein Ssd n=1 Tax=Nocardia crassostreae TaxID=53428 RepID=UPI00082D3FA3|nr:septum site-determining protein Ssd [Nocardia crassostreae]